MTTDYVLNVLRPQIDKYLADVDRFGYVDPDSDFRSELQSDFDQLRLHENWERPREEIEPMIRGLHGKLQKIMDKFEAPTHEQRAALLFDAAEKGRTAHTVHEFTDSRGRLVRDTRVGPYLRSEVILTAAANAIFRRLVERVNNPRTGRRQPDDADVVALDRFCEEHNISRPSAQQAEAPALLGSEVFAGISSDAIEQGIHPAEMIHAGARVLRDGTRLIIEPNEPKEGGGTE